MARSKNRMSNEINAGSMADIAFLLLIFFLVTTTIASDKGILNFLPPKQDPNVPPPDIQKNERNIFNVLINANNDLLVEGEYRRKAAEAQKRSNSSDHPGEAVISIKTNRGTSYAVFLEVFDLAKKAYFEIYGKRVGLSAEEYRALTGDDEASKALQDKGKEGIPMAISIAEPDKIGGN